MPGEEASEGLERVAEEVKRTPDPPRAIKQRRQRVARKFGQAPVCNAAVQYDTEADGWSVTDDTFRTDDAIYLANQDVWIGNWSGGSTLVGESPVKPTSHKIAQ